MNEYRAATSPFSFLPPTALPLFSLLVAASFGPRYAVLSFSLSFSLSLSYSDQMSNSCGATVWLINALEEPREVEHNKQTGEGGRKKRVRGEIGERRMREPEVSVRVWLCVYIGVCPCVRNPSNAIRNPWLDSQRGVPFPLSVEVEVFSLSQFPTIMLTHTVWPISQEWDSRETHTCSLTHRKCQKTKKDRKLRQRERGECNFSLLHCWGPK